MFVPAYICLYLWNQDPEKRYCVFKAFGQLLSYGINMGPSSVQSLSHVRLIVTPWIVAHQASLSITNSRSLLKLMSIESVMPSNLFILCHPLFLLPSIFPSIRVFSNESAICTRWPKYWSFSFNISPSNEHLGLISFMMAAWISLQPKGLSRVFSNTIVQFKSISSLALSFLYSLTLTSIHDHRKNHNLD